MKKLTTKILLLLTILITTSCSKIKQETDINKWQKDRIGLVIADRTHQHIWRYCAEMDSASIVIPIYKDELGEFVFIIDSINKKEKKFYISIDSLQVLIPEL